MFRITLRNGISYDMNLNDYDETLTPIQFYEKYINNDKKWIQIATKQDCTLLLHSDEIVIIEKRKKFNSTNEIET